MNYCISPDISVSVSTFGSLGESVKITIFSLDSYFFFPALSLEYAMYESHMHSIPEQLYTGPKIHQD